MKPCHISPISRVGYTKIHIKSIKFAVKLFYGLNKRSTEFKYVCMYNVHTYVSKV